MSERCVMIRLTIKGVWIIFIQVYAPTDYIDEGGKGCGRQGP